MSGWGADSEDGWGLEHKDQVVGWVLKMGGDWNTRIRLGVGTEDGWGLKQVDRVRSWG